MSRLSGDTDTIAAATRGLIVQRLMVDGWSAAQAASSFGVSERQVVRWVAAYRRDGMASLHEDAAAEFATMRWARRLRRMIRHLFGEPRNNPGQAEPAPLVISRRKGSDPARNRRSS